jgi:hypothetical protein
MTEPDIKWYWDKKMMEPDERGFYWVPVSTVQPIFVVQCKAHRINAHWNVCRVELDPQASTETKQQTMDALLDVCRMRYADELLNQGEMK